MSPAETSAQADGCPVPHASPIDTDGPRIPLYSPEFAVDPHHFYREMRRNHGALAPIDIAPGVPATLVVDYETAVRVLNDPDHFPADPRIWQQGIPEDCPVRPMMAWMPNALRSSGVAHQRYREAFVAAVDGIDLHTLHATVERVAVPLINEFCTTGSADLVMQYAFPLAFEAMDQLLGCPADIGRRLPAGMAALFDTVNAAWGMQTLTETLLELVHLRRAEPGDDLTTRLIRHPAKLTDEELVAQIMVLYGAGIEPMQNLITNTLLLMLTDERFGGSMLGGALSTRDALDEVLFDDPPLSNFCTSYPRQAVLLDGAWLPANHPVLISLAAANTDPAIRGGDRTGNRSHLAWGAGPHACPARSVAYLLCQDAIDQLLDALPELRLAQPVGELTWRPGPFHRALAALPVRFPPAPRLPVGDHGGSAPPPRAGAS
ncbi:cytochrome P450 [Nocardia higoensis]|uniref:Cytochrome P450 n=1 Tax=Nocardia higoensis TaxID=228599 RepID=A0ABS0D9B9_9NOCA|nr:cytochrome P450 [Nocardia higoensis]